MEHGTGHHSRRRFEHVGVTPVVWSDGKNYTSGAVRVPQGEEGWKSPV